MPTIRRRRTCQVAAALVFLGLLAGSARADGGYLVPPVPRFESPPPGELADIRAAVRTIKLDVVLDFLSRRALDPDALAVRDAHPKHHGCVRGRLEVRPDLPRRLAAGVFRPGARYAAWVRFSNATGVDHPDAFPDGRGMAIKLLGIPGPKLLDGVFVETPWAREEHFTQDFALINHPVFFVRNVREYRNFSAALASDNLLELVVFFITHPESLSHIIDIFSQPAFNPLEIRYHSMVPFLLGPRQAVKLSTSPVSCATGEPVTQTPRPRDDPDFLRRAMKETLDPVSGAPACFELAAHLRRDPSLPIEDATEEWDAARSPRVAIASLRIEPQIFDTQAQQRFCEHLSFTPWHAVPDHQPLGGLNRSRLHAYHAVSALRHWLNRVPAIVPGRDEDP